MVRSTPGVIEIYDAFRAAGVDDATAAAAAAAVPVEQELATRQDIANLRAEIYRALWLQAVGIVTVVAALLKLLP